MRLGPAPARRAGRIAAATVAAVTLAAAARAGTPPPTPGPAARVGGAIDRAWDRVSDSVADALLVTRVRLALLDRLKEDGLRVSIAAHDGAVELSGAVKEPTSVELAARAAASVKGVRSVRSDVRLADGTKVPEPPVARVVGSVERSVGDAVLEARVKARLLEQLGKVAFTIDVGVSGGAVTLSGTVPDAARQRLALSIVKGTSGVKEVRDGLTVRPQG
jgi:hyperosmotically inducible periplasmic protein